MWASIFFIFSNNKRWVLSNVRAITKAYPNSWFINEKGQEIRSDRRKEHWFEVTQSLSMAGSGRIIAFFPLP
jgi:hypothetical protein